MAKLMEKSFRQQRKTLSYLRSLRTTAFSWLYWLATFVYFELLVHIAAYGMPGLEFGYVLGFSAVFLDGSSGVRPVITVPKSVFE